MTSISSSGAAHEVSAASYFTDDEHFNKRLQEGIGASTLFADAMGTHRNQQEQRAINRGEVDPISKRSSASSSRPGTGGGGPGTRGAAALLAQREQQRQESGGGGGGGGGVSPTATSTSGGAAAAASSPSPAGAASSPGGNAARYLSSFPQISMDDPLYSSTLAMLKKTRTELSQLSTELSATNMISELPASEDVRRIVAKIFADPRNAETISESEWKRREHQYLSQREQLATRINDHLNQEKQALAEEIKRLGIDSQS